jgi:outer membrane protein, heavy metal efflux system
MIIIIVLLLALAPGTLAAQAGPGIELAELIDQARATNPEIHAARRMADASAARIPQAGALPDPVLAAGLMNVPASRPGIAGDEMAMATVQLSQMLPAPGVRGERVRAARAAHEAALQRLAEVELGVVARVKISYYELYFAEQAIAVLERNRGLLEELAEIALRRYAVGAAPQHDVLRAQTEVTRIDEQLAGMRGTRVGLLAELNALAAQPTARDFVAAYPLFVARLARAAPTAGAFTLAALQTGMADGFPSLAELHAAALEDRPALRAQRHDAEQARASARLAERERIPDVEIMLGYGFAGAGGMNRLTAMLAVPLPVFAARRQGQAVLEAAAEADAVVHAQRSMEYQVLADVTARYSEALRVREQIALLSDGVIPHAQAAIASAITAYQAGTVDFASLLEAHAALFRNDIELGRQLADFGRALARLELAVGRDLIQENLP